MKSSYITNSVLLILIIGLYFFINYQAPQIDYQRLSTLHAEDASSIIIERDNRDDIILNKKSQQWFITQPIQASANTTRVNLILDLLSSRSQGHLEPLPNQSLKQFDLQPAKVTLRINDQTFEFGNVDPLSKHRYIYHDTLIHLIADTVAPLLNATAASFIDNRLFSADHHITKLTLPALINQKSQSSPVTISLKDGHWISSNTTLSADSLTTTIDAWQHAYGMQVFTITPDSTESGIWQTITVEFVEQATIELQLQFDGNSMYVIDGSKGLKYQFPLSHRQQFFPIQEAAQ